MTETSIYGNPCASDHSIRGKVTSGPANGPWPWGKTIIYAGESPVLIDIEHCSGYGNPLNYPFKLVVYGKKSGFSPQPIILEVMMQGGAVAPFVSRQQATGYAIEAHMLLANATANFAYYLTPVAP
jgi:hypothetical protein